MELHISWIMRNVNKYVPNKVKTYFPIGVVLKVENR